MANINKTEDDNYGMVYFLSIFFGKSSMEVIMKGKIFLTILLLFAAVVAAEAQKDKKQLKVVPDSVSVDSTEYELIVMDQGFDKWFMMQPADLHTIEYYRGWNRMYVSEWNQRYMAPMYNRGLYESYIDYDPSIKYGYEFERKLYYYFKYFEEVNHVKLLQEAR